MKIAKYIIATILCAVSFSATTAQVVVNADEVVGKIKVMNAVNNGPSVAGSTQTRSNFHAYKGAEFSYARLHDAPIAWNWAHTVDISCVFPDFEADEKNPASYDFELTDRLIKDIYDSGTKVFYRLGQSIEHWSKKYGVNPPADFKKWARICEHIVRHYNEGWANGYHYNIEYWEIWNEADLNWKSGNSPTWTGTKEEYYRLYEITATHLKKHFPYIKVGGPAYAGSEEWLEAFLAHLTKHKVPMDFFSYHAYFPTIERFMEHTAAIKTTLDKCGYGDVSLILNEWNYISNWTDEFVYSVETISSYKGAAYVAATMQAFQDSYVDMLMYYDARPETVFNGLFDLYTMQPRHPYYALYSWTKLRRLGTQVKTDVGGLQNIYATAAKNEKGQLAFLLTYYTDDGNDLAPKPVTIDFKGIAVNEAVAHISDRFKMHTETPIEIVNSRTEILMEPNSYILIELR